MDKKVRAWIRVDIDDLEFDNPSDGYALADEKLNEILKDYRWEYIDNCSDILESWE